MSSKLTLEKFMKLNIKFYAGIPWTWRKRPRFFSKLLWETGWFNWLPPPRRSSGFYVFVFVCACCLYLCLSLFICVCLCLLRCVLECCSLLQSVAVCCSLLQSVAVCCSLLQSVATCMRVLQCVVECWSVSQCAAVRCRVLQCDDYVVVCWVCCSAQTWPIELAASPEEELRSLSSCFCVCVWQSAVGCCRVLQFVAKFCSVLQYVAVCCRVLQCAVRGTVWLFPKAYFTHKPTYAHLLLFMSSWNMQEHWDSEDCSAHCNISTDPI